MISHSDANVEILRYLWPCLFLIEVFVIDFVRVCRSLLLDGRPTTAVYLVFPRRFFLPCDHGLNLLDQLMCEFNQSTNTPYSNLDGISKSPFTMRLDM